MIQSWFHIAGLGRSLTAAEKPPTGSEPTRKEAGEGGQPNKPLGFRLKDIDHGHPCLAERRLDPATAEYFGVGFFSGRAV